MKENILNIQAGYDQSVESMRRSDVCDRSAHAGNLSDTSQFVSEAANAKIIQFSGNQGSDPTYTPTYILSGEEKIQIMNAGEQVDKLTAFLDVDRDNLKYLADRFKTPAIKRVNTVAQLHIAGAQELLGDDKVVPYHSIFLSSEGQEVLQGLAQIPGTCDRFLNSDGILEYQNMGAIDPNQLVSTIRSISESSTPGNPNSLNPGPILSNVANTVGHAFTRALPILRDTNQSEVTIYHCSGPDMIVYTQKEKFQKEIERISIQLATRLQLGDVSITEYIYPASELRIVAPDTQEVRLAFDRISCLVEMIFALNLEGEPKNDEIKRLSIEYGLCIENEDRLTTAAKDVVTKLADILKNELPRVAGLNFQPRGCSQWARLDDGRVQPTIPDAFIKLTVKQIMYFTKLVEQIAKGNTIVSKKLPDDIK